MYKRKLFENMDELLKFLNDNNDLHKNVKDDIISVINDYKLIQSKLINYLLVYKFN